MCRLAGPALASPKSRDFRRLRDWHAVRYTRGMNETKGGNVMLLSFYLAPIVFGPLLAIIIAA